MTESRIYSFWEKGIPIGSRIQGVNDGALDWDALLQSGELLMLLAALSMSAGTIIVGYVKRYADPIVATGWHMIIGGIPLMILSALWETSPTANL